MPLKALQNSSTFNHEITSPRQQALCAQGNNLMLSLIALSANSSFCPSTMKEIEQKTVMMPELVPKQLPPRQALNLDDFAWSKLWDDVT